MDVKDVLFMNGEVNFIFVVCMFDGEFGVYFVDFGCCWINIDYIGSYKIVLFF